MAERQELGEEAQLVSELNTLPAADPPSSNLADHLDNQRSLAEVNIGSSSHASIDDGSSSSSSVSAEEQPAHSPAADRQASSSHSISHAAIPDLDNNNGASGSRMAVKRVMRELVEMANEPSLNFIVGPKGDDLLEWNGQLTGPAGTPYEGGVFNIDITFPEIYPFKPPKVFFKTPIYHCNINKRGVVCIDILQKEWTPALTISKVLLSISSLLSDCNPNDPMVPRIAALYKTNRDQHDSEAKKWTDRYAKRQ